MNRSDINEPLVASLRKTCARSLGAGPEGIVPIRLVTAPERHFSPGRFGLAELIDFEAQLAS
ncbi:MAG: hypothetical protein WBM96_17470, partial [Polyangiales bacterium]